MARARAEAAGKKSGKGVDKTGLVRCPKCEQSEAARQRGSEAGEEKAPATECRGTRKTCPECVDLDGYVRWVPDQELLAWGMPLIEMANRIERYGLGEVERVWGEVDALGLMCLECYEQEVAG